MTKKTGSTEEPHRIVLVGTYRGDQLKDWPGWYCWPLDGGVFAAKSAKVAKREGRAPSRPQGGSGSPSEPPEWLPRVSELWLYRGTADERRYRAEFIGVKTREELICDYGYPGGDDSATKNTKDAKREGRALSRPSKPHGTYYALFKTEILYRHKNDPPGEADAVIVRLKDFARTPKVRKQLREYLESPDRNDPDLAKRLPSIVTSVPPERLRVCEAAVQLELMHVTSIYAEPFCKYILGTDTTPLFFCGDALSVLRELPSESIDCCMTSPPYWNKRQYAGGGIGLESDYHAFIDNLVSIFAEVKRVLKSSGSFWLNIGDSYLDKNLLNVPSRVAIRMQDEQGWILRNTVIWNKVKGCPDNSEDKLRNIYEPIYHFVKSARGYYYDVDSVRRKPHQAKIVNGAVVSATGVSGIRYKRKIELSTELSEEQKADALDELNIMLSKVRNGEVSDFRMIIKGEQRTTHSDSECVSGRARELHERGFYFLKYNPKGAKPSDLWDIIPEDTQGRVSHFAPYPEDLCKTPLLLTCPVNGIVLDPFSGTGTTAVVAQSLGRKSVGIDISNEYIEDARKRVCRKAFQPELNLREGCNG